MRITLEDVALREARVAVGFLELVVHVLRHTIELVHTAVTEGHMQRDGLVVPVGYHAGNGLLEALGIGRMRFRVNALEELVRRDHVLAGGLCFLALRLLLETIRVMRFHEALVQGVQFLQRSGWSGAKELPAFCDLLHAIRSAPGRFLGKRAAKMRNGGWTCT